MTPLVLALALSSVTDATLLDYGAPSECPSASQFMDAVTARGGDLSRPSSVAQARVLVVSIRKQDAGFGGTFHVRDQRGATGKRQISGRSCAEVADALAVVTAIELQAEAGGAETAPAPPTPTPTPTPAAPPPPTPPDDRLRGTTRAFPKRTETVRVGAGDLRFDLSRGAALDAGVTVGLVPSIWLPTYSLKLSVANFVTTPEGAQRIAGLVLGVRVDYLGNGTYDTPDTRTVVNGVSFGMDFCQAPVYDSKGLVLLLCGEYGGGFVILDTKGLDGTPMRKKTVGFGTFSGVIDVQYSFTSRFFVTARVAGGFRFGDIAAERTDGSHVFDSSSAGFASGTAGLGLRY